MRGERLVQVEQAGKRYGRQIALHPISFSIECGTVDVVTGPQNCGKSTLLKLLAGLASPTTGLVLLENRPITRQDANRIAYLPQNCRLYPFWTVKQALNFQASQFGDFNPEKAKILLRLLDLEEENRVRDFAAQSGLLLALSRDADLLLLDQPTIPPDLLARCLRQTVDLSHQSVVIAVRDLCEIPFPIDHTILLKKNG